jgi:hypothetical protein
MRIEVHGVVCSRGRDRRNQPILPVELTYPAFDVVCWGIIGMDVLRMVVLLVLAVWAD